MKLREVPEGIEILDPVDCESAARLTYFSQAINGHGAVETTQARLEDAARLGKNRQATRYSVHGLHEYKGKFNPQVVRALLNIFEVSPGQRVLDPFCGSGTTLVECAHSRAIGYGTDINPLAVYIAQAKLQALVTPVAAFRAVESRLSASLKRTKRWKVIKDTGPRAAYLQSWFDDDVLAELEGIRLKIEEIAGDLAPVFLVIASNLLRDYSQQDPNDLRIRRRKSPLPETPFSEALLAATFQTLERIEAAQAVLGTSLPVGKALLCDVGQLSIKAVGGRFDAAITSPPYAMALPYIDTQRLSLVWLKLVEPEQILSLEAELIGSRELRGNARRALPAQLENNQDNLPEEQANYCLRLQHALGQDDGFRRQAVPMLLYRYFASMKGSFKAVKRVMNRRAPFGLIVGHNHTTLGGIRWDIDTPSHLASLAAAEGWSVEELMPLQTYHRYGYHMSNAVAAETLIVLRNK
ncbi:MULTISPECIES: TRM11 family SAM-dependent methyltransferase [Chelativorans]|uniref:TRM11 family SAM-dependent methyltransferase n=1 Tax=Chelativorans TaxID=449972 RepID=UPI0031B62094